MLLEPSDTPQALGKASYWGIRDYRPIAATALVEGAARAATTSGSRCQCPVPAGDEQLRAFDLEGGFAPEILDAAGDWTGIVYFDDISIRSSSGGDCLAPAHFAAHRARIR